MLFALLSPLERLFKRIYPIPEILTLCFLITYIIRRIFLGLDGSFH